MRRHIEYNIDTYGIILTPCYVIIIIFYHTTYHPEQRMPSYIEYLHTQRTHTCSTVKFSFYTSRSVESALAQNSSEVLCMIYIIIFYYMGLRCDRFEYS